MRTQYQWLRRTLAQNQNAVYKFIFAHQRVGRQGRGGAGNLRLQLALIKASVEFVHVSCNKQQNKQVAQRYLLPKRP